MRSPNVAVVGATGLVGQEMVRVLEQRSFPVNTMQLFASDRSAGKRVYFKREPVEVRELKSSAFDSIDLALISAGADISRQYSPLLAKAGAVVVDNSAAFRMEPWVPLVVPEVNPGDIGHHKGIIANPNCSTIQMVVVLAPLHKVNPIKKIIVSTYQAVSGTGSAAIEELNTQARQVLDGKQASPHIYSHQIAFNVLPEIDVFLYNGYTREEWKMVEETRKILHAPQIAISATCVRVPVFVGHSEAVSVEFSYPITPEEAWEVLRHAPGVRLQDEPEISLYPNAWAAAGGDDVLVGRLRQDTALPNGLSMWVVADNLRKGAALNAVQIAETLVERGQYERAG
ncbi:MAG: aspartate-semialdehyde dehydrogenase [Dehalococcoidia bacterium]|nr:aspartate-semialdehyde dehydrogenase [Dehalococcoidia bacterium]